MAKAAKRKPAAAGAKATSAGAKALAAAVAKLPGGAVAKLVAGAVAARVSDEAMLAWLWPKVEAEVRGANDHDDVTLFPGLKAAALAAATAGLGKKALEKELDLAFDRVWAGLQKLPAPKMLAKAKGKKGGPAAKAGGILSNFLSGLFGGSGGSSGGLGLGTPSNEFSKLSSFVRNNVDGGVSGWSGIRKLMFQKFGAAGNPSKGIDRINAYYTALVSGTLNNKSTPVHPRVKAGIEKAIALLTSLGFASAPSGLKSVGGFNIRRNANDSSSLSNHSFGWAMDLDPTLNPNTRKDNLPVDEIIALTGVDIYGPASERIRNSVRTFAETLPDAQALCGASAALVAAHASRDSLKAAWMAAIARLYGANFDQAAIDTAFDLAEAGSTSNLRTHVGAAGVPSAKTSECASRLIASLKLFRESQKPGLRPEVTGSAATVTRFGFCNLPAELVAALAASDGGGLNWLGSARNTKDSMHFDLRDVDKPALF